MSTYSVTTFTISVNNAQAAAKLEQIMTSNEAKTLDTLWNCSKGDEYLSPDDFAKENPANAFRQMWDGYVEETGYFDDAMRQLREEFEQVGMPTDGVKVDIEFTADNDIDFSEPNKCELTIVDGKLTSFREAVVTMKVADPWLDDIGYGTSSAARLIASLDETQKSELERNEWTTLREGQWPSDWDNYYDTGILTDRAFVFPNGDGWVCARVQPEDITLESYETRLAAVADAQHPYDLPSDLAAYDKVVKKTLARGEDRVAGFDEWLEQNDEA